eukprot:1123172-Alexandrium_andersonii.AAC.1
MDSHDTCGRASRSEGLRRSLEEAACSAASPDDQDGRGLGLLRGLPGAQRHSSVAIGRRHMGQPT